MGQITYLIIETQKKVYIFRVVYLSSASASSKLLLTSSSEDWYH